MLASESPALAGTVSRGGSDWQGLQTRGSGPVTVGCAPVPVLCRMQRLPREQVSLKKIFLFLVISKRCILSSHYASPLLKLNNFRCLVVAPIHFHMMSIVSAIHSDACRVSPSALCPNRKPQSPIRKKKSSRTKHRCPVLLVNQFPSEDSRLTVDEIRQLELEECVKLSHLVDRARDLVCDNLDTCASWRRKGMNTVIHLVHAYGPKDETAAHAIALLDRFLAVKVIHKSEDPIVFSTQSGGIWDKADCYAVACYLIATKFKDVCAPCLGDMMCIIRPTWPKELILQCEEEVLSSIGWAIHVTTGATARRIAYPHAYRHACSSLVWCRSVQPCV